MPPFTPLPLEAARESPRFQLLHKLGRYSTIHQGRGCGTVCDAQAQRWNWRVLPGGSIDVIEAREAA